MSEAPLISIIIPLYNAEKYIEETLKSAINQTWANKEIIIVDDGSTDNSLSIANRYIADNISVYSYGGNKGECYASNFGYYKSTGKFIKYLDADDIIDKDYLTNMMAVADNEHDMYFSYCMNFYGDLSEGRLSPYPVKNWTDMNPVDFLLDPESIMRQGGRWLIPRVLIEKAGLWNETLSLINDYEYFTRLCLSCNKVRYVKNSVLFYRQLPNSLSTQKSLKAFTSAYNSIKLSADQLLERENSNRVRLYIANTYQGLLYDMYPRNKPLLKKIEAAITSLGGANKPITVAAGGKTLLLAKIIGWKMAFAIRYYFSLMFKKKNSR